MTETQPMVKNPLTRVYDVIIVGAGIAGLAAADTLIKRGMWKILILESSERVGGRIHSVKSPEGNVIELGAQWLHGIQNKLYTFARRHDLLSSVISYEGEGKFLTIDGYEYPQVAVEHVNDVIDQIITSCSTFYNSDQECDFSFGDYLQNEFENYLIDNVSPDDQGMWREVLNWHILFHCIDNSCASLRDLSAKMWGQYDFSGGHYQTHENFRRGYSSVIEKLMEGISAYKIKMSAKVDKILWNLPEIKVYCEDKSEFKAKHVIVTTSLGVLKHQKDLFEPPLSANHQNAINSIGFGSIGKVFLEYEEKWWDNDKGFQIIWPIDQDNKIENIFTEQERSWLQHISGFDVLSIATTTILLGWVAEEGERIMSELTIDVVKEHCHKLLCVFTGIKDLPEPRKCWRSNWGKDPHIRGGFSNITRACDKTSCGPAEMAEAIRDENGDIKVLLAGEACHPKFFSTAHGAFDSGVDQALKITEMYGFDSDP